jgi:hypothetical protein
MEDRQQPGTREGHLVIKPQVVLAAQLGMEEMAPEAR